MMEDIQAEQKGARIQMRKDQSIPTPGGLLARPLHPVR